MANLEGLHHLHCLVCLMLFSCTLCCGGKSCHVLTCFFGGDILLRIYCVKLFIGISHIIIVGAKGRFEMMRGLWRGMLVSFLFLSSFFFRFLRYFLLGTSYFFEQTRQK